MKLSEAMREGAKLRPQGFGGLFTLHSNGITESCALGAAFEGETGSTSCSNGRFREWAGKHELTRTQTGGGVGLNDLYEQIVLKNDHERLSREAIATWLEAQGL